MRANRILALVALVALGLVLAYGLKLAYSPQPSLLQGQIEAREYNVSSKVPGRVEQVLVRRGDRVAEGDLLFAIHSPELDAKLMQAEGGRDAAKAKQSEADNGARRQEIMAAKEQWLKAQAAATLAKTTYNRVKNLFNEGVAARQKRDEAFTQWQAAKYTEQAALAMYQMAQEGARVELKAAAAGNARMAEGAVKEVSAIMQDSQMRAPKTGEISDVLLQAGELAPSGFPIVSLIDMKDAWAVFQVREDQLKGFKKGQKIRLNIPALGQDIEFTVSHISVMGEFATWRSTESGHDFDMRTFEVELRPSQPISDLRVGMSVLLRGE
ncbi:HlyD family secretion protein [Shewanella glacialipiscicola]|uniref:Membrane protein n=1 Tax=Shewanella glacialipiscicola TaxID=614069 RepID=A0ABQ6J5S2_9GAMM|nr:efflux RND transporter periplasmic adaptor subunit [Shewanella glacialipiscicola]MCL1087468.1 efflux RND transporter periplasmic adaptor subunit [Shewanella glacialipiscicola]GIU09040.1 membrane protein [Shewanella glacialipiscicola]GMA83487.1 membrane protein [Shewanella glacialipiscicola]